MMIHLRIADYVDRTTSSTFPNERTSNNGQTSEFFGLKIDFNYKCV